jgi:hypothetical protein
VVVFTAVMVLIALGLPFTPFPYDGGDLASGLTFLIPAGTLGAALAMFGITGVGADEITFYTAVFLAVSSAAIALLGVYTLLQVFGIKFG